MFKVNNENTKMTSMTSFSIVSINCRWLLEKDLYGFSVTIPSRYMDVCDSSFLLRTARLRNSLPAECFTLIYDLNCLKSIFNWQLLS